MSDQAATPASSTTTTASPGAVTTASTIKPAYKTTEAYVNLAVAILGQLVSLGVIGSGSPVNVIGGQVLTFLAAALHTWSRTSIKNNAAAVAP